ncbi:MAG: hypothetical protein M1482_01775 [Chloroflexi bacterium]|nr:hypothetical protein [Chloroflexota bacterium]
MNTRPRVYLILLLGFAAILSSAGCRLRAQSADRTVQPPTAQPPAAEPPVGRAQR